MKTGTSPYLVHLFVCTNDRAGARKSCADGENMTLRAALKTAVAERGWKGRVRVSPCGCLGLCTEGPNVMIYPQGILFSEASLSDLETILARVEGLLER